ncbi:MAG: substrate-binding domain-containing protein [Phycisphaerae bacterium]
MPRPRTQHVIDVKARLIARLGTSFLRPGDRFLSARAVAAKFGVSYQTAHRLLAELQSEGHLLRHPASGTYLPGKAEAPKGVTLLFHPRAKRPGSFGHRLASELATALARDGVTFRLTHTEKPATVPPETFPVVWEVPAAVTALAARQRPALLLNDRPPPGLDSLHIDSVSCDDYSGGACAAQLIQQRLAGAAGLISANAERASRRKAAKPEILTEPPRVAILSGPPGDSRSNQRVAGFCSLIPGATITPCPTWYVEDALRLAPQVLAGRPDAIFCCNDRLAQAVILHARENQLALPPIVGFDDAPVAEQLDLTTLAIPWGPLLATAVSLIRRRLAGDAEGPVHQIFPPRPVVRAL